MSIFLSENKTTPPQYFVLLAHLFLKLNQFQYEKNVNSISPSLFYDYLYR